MEDCEEKVGGKRRRLEDKRRRRLIGEDELREGIDFLPVNEILRLANSGFTFLRTFMRHRGKGAVVGELQEVDISDRIKILLKIIRQPRMYYFRNIFFQEIPAEFNFPPEELVSIKKFNVNIGPGFTQKPIDLSVKHFSNLLKDHWLWLNCSEKTSIRKSFDFAQRVQSFLRHFDLFYEACL